jgi:outer membrane protein assembly factor BamB
MKTSISRAGLVLAISFAAGEMPAAEAAVSFKYFRSDAGTPAQAGPLPDNLEPPEAFRWRVELDSGHSTPVLQAGKIFLTTYHRDSKELATVALDEATGRLLWRSPVAPTQVEQTHPVGSPATATPACDGRRVFAFFGSAGLFCYDLEGRKLWEQHLGPFRDEYGAGSSPIVVEDKVILNQDHDIDSFLVAFDRATGQVRWKIPRPDAVRSYATPVVWTHEGRTEILVAGALQLGAFAPADGQRLWWANGLARIVIPTPLTSGPMIYMASWAPGGDASKRVELVSWAAALAKWDANHDGKLARAEIDDHEVLDRFTRMDLDQDGALDQREWERHAEVFHRAQNAMLAIKPVGQGQQGDSAVIWKYGRGVPYVSTPLLSKGILWMVKEGGIVTKLDAGSGQMLQEERVPGFGNYFASPVAGDGKVYFSSESGTVSVVADEPGWRVISSRDLHEKIYATPVLQGGRLYLRTEQGLYCFQGPQRQAKSPL